MPTKKTSVLIVDDESELLEALVFDFKRRNYETYFAKGGYEALEIFRTHKVDVILSDVKMPEGDGKMLLEKIKELDADLPFFIFVASDLELSLEEAYDLGSEAVFLKPFDRKALLDAVFEIVRSKEERWSPKSPRSDVDLKIELLYPGLDMARQSKVLNIGRGGFFMALEDSFPKPGVQIHFHIRLQGAMTSEVEGHGIVRWVRTSGDPQVASGCGIEFLDLVGSSRQTIIEYINSLRTRPYIPRI